MNDFASASDPGTPSVPPPNASAPPLSTRLDATRLTRWMPVALIVLALLLIASWWSGRNDNQRLRAELAQRLQSGDTVNAETRSAMKAATETVKELQAKVNVLESKQLEAQSQQLALEQLYQDLSRNRDEWALAEIEQVLSTASQQLQLAGNVQGALIALQNADGRLSRSDKPQFITVRRSIARDIEKLKVLPSVDLTGIALRLDSIIGQIDHMPLLSDEKPAQAAVLPKDARRAAEKPAAGTGKRSEWLQRADDWWQSWSTQLWGETRDLLRVRTVVNPDALLLSPTQAFYARENLKLRLLNARLALLSRNETAFRSDMIAAQDIIAKYFDTRAKQTQATQALLRQVQGSNLAIDMPSLADSLNAVRNFKTKP